MARAAAELFLDRAQRVGPEGEMVMTETVSGSAARRGKGSRKGLKIERNE